MWLRSVVLMFLVCVSAFGRARTSGYCEQGGQVVVTAGQSSTTKVQQSYPQCRITVYLTGTLTLATIYSDNSGTAKANPFTSSTTGYWFYYADNGTYDIRMDSAGISVPFTWGAVASIDPAYPLPVFGNQLEYLRIRPNTGNTTTLQFSPLTPVVSSNYDFPSQAPGGTLTGSIPATVALSPCPVGVSGTHTIAGHLPHLLFVSGGTGTAEAVAITGGTCVGNGVAGGTVTFTPANSHSGAWTVKSNTTGVQEAIYASATAGSVGVTGSVLIPPGRIDLWGNIPGTAAALTVPDTYDTRVRGSGIQDTLIFTHFTTGDAFTYDYNGGAVRTVDVGDFQLGDNSGSFHTSGRMLTVKGRNFGIVSNIFSYWCYDCYSIEGSGSALYTGLSGTANHYAMNIGCTPSCSTSGTLVDSDFVTHAAGGIGINILNQTVGWLIANNQIGDQSGAGAIAISLTTPGLGPLNEVVLSNNIIDGYDEGIAYIGAGGACATNALQVVGNRISSGTHALNISNSGCNVLAVGNLFSAATGGTARSVYINGSSGVRIFNSLRIDSTGDCGIYIAGTNTDTQILGNDIGAFNTPTTGICVAGTNSGLDIRDNHIKYGTAAMTVSGTNSPFTVSNNFGIDNVIPVVASAATIPVPINPIFTLTGSTPVFAVSFPFIAGSKFQFTATAASPGVWTAGPTIGNSFTPTQNVPNLCYWDGIKAWCSSGSGGGGAGTFTSLTVSGNADFALGSGIDNTGIGFFNGIQSNGLVNGTSFRIPGSTPITVIDGASGGHFSSVTSEAGILMKGVAPAASAGQVSLGSAVAASSNCGSLAGAAGCLVINVGGAIHYAPYF